jgi:hypothetical protein
MQFKASQKTSKKKEEERRKSVRSAISKCKKEKMYIEPS